MTTNEHGPHAAHPPLTVEIGHAVVVALRPEARRRDVPIRRLISDLLSAVGEDPSLVEAIFGTLEDQRRCSMLVIERVRGNPVFDDRLLGIADIEQLVAHQPAQLTL